MGCNRAGNAEMNWRNMLRRKQAIHVLFAALGACVLLHPHTAAAAVFDWDNFSGNGNFNDAVNWLPGGGPPELGDTAIFDGQLQGSGIGDNVVNVSPGTAINDMQVYNSSGFPATVVDLTIGDGATSSRLDLDDLFGDSLLVGNSPGDTATLNLLGGRLDTFGAKIGGRATLNVINPSSLWDSTSVVVSGDGPFAVPGVGLGLQAQIATHGSLFVGDDSGSGGVVVDGGGLGTSARWTVDQSVEIGPTNHFPYRGEVTLQNGGRMTVGADMNVRPGWDDVLLNILSVESGGELNVAGALSWNYQSVLELFDSSSSITTGDIDSDRGVFNWTGGTLHITNGRLRIDDSVFADLDQRNLGIGNGMTLKVTRVTPNEDSLTIGNVGTGRMTVLNGGGVESYHGYVGEATAADGTVDISGDAARWSVTEDLVVGFKDSAVGRLVVTGGSQVTANSIYLGQRDAANGTITVDGGVLTSTAVMAVGGYIDDDGFSNPVAGGTAQLDVQNAGSVDVAKKLIVFGGGAVSLTGDGSQIAADQIVLEPGAAISDAAGTSIITNYFFGLGSNANFAGNLTLGYSSGGAIGFGTHNVAPGQTLTVGGNLTVGFDASGQLGIYGGTVNSPEVVIGAAAGSDSSRVSAIGAGTFWYANRIDVGGDGIAPQSQATLQVSEDAQAVVSDRIKVWAPGLLAISDGIVSVDHVEIDGALEGNGTILLGGGSTAVVNRGTVAPGAFRSPPSWGVITINGAASTTDAYAQEASGRLSIEIGGASPSQIDRLDIVGGSAALDGQLDVSLVDLLNGNSPYVPKAGDSFEILTADGGLGGSEFVTLPTDLPSLTGQLFWDIVYGAQTVRLDVHTPFSADFDRDGDVDGKDRGIWESSFGINAQADADGDSVSDGRDFLDWQRQITGDLNPPKTTSVDLTQVADFTPLSDQFRDVGLLFGARQLGEPVLQDSNTIDAIAFLGDYFLFSPDVYGAVGILYFVEPGTSIPRVVNSITCVADGSFHAGESIELVAFDGLGNQVAAETFDGAIGPLALISFDPGIGFSSLEVRTLGDPGVAVGELAFARNGGATNLSMVVPEPTTAEALTLALAVVGLLTRRAACKAAKVLASSARAPA